VRCEDRGAVKVLPHGGYLYRALTGSWQHITSHGHTHIACTSTSNRLRLGDGRFYTAATTAACSHCRSACTVGTTTVASSRGANVGKMAQARSNAASTALLP
jgi:hypothetical protein